MSQQQVKTTVELPANIHKQLKIIAVANNKTLKDITTEAITRIIEHNGRIPSKQDIIREYWREKQRAYYYKHRQDILLRKKLKRIQRYKMQSIFDTKLWETL